MIRRYFKQKQGYTLVEMLLVVAIVGLLAFVGAHKFGDMLRKSRESSTVSSLGLIRSALNIYFSDNLANFPRGPQAEGSSLLDDSLIPKYLKKIPNAYVFPHHPQTDSVDTSESSNFLVTDTTGDGNWVYVSTYSSPMWGHVAVECYQVDSKGVLWTLY